MASYILLILQTTCVHVFMDMQHACTCQPSYLFLAREGQHTTEELEIKEQLKCTGLGYGSMRRMRGRGLRGGGDNFLKTRQHFLKDTVTEMQQAGSGGRGGGGGEGK